MEKMKSEAAPLEFEEKNDFVGKESAIHGSYTADEDFDDEIVAVDSSEVDPVARLRSARLKSMTIQENVKYPPDCYSFLSLYGPFEKPNFFFFGISVWIFQIAFHILMVLRVISKKYSTNEDTDNPDRESLLNFIPANVGIISRVTQYLALAAYCFFADDSLKDIIKAIESFPRFDKVKEGDKVGSMMFSCFLRMSQGVLATFVVLLLVIQTSDVLEIILNFAAVNFISGFDDTAFELAQWGKYGPMLKIEANRIEDLPVPDCVFRKRDHIRYRYTISLIATCLLVVLTVVATAQASAGVWLTERLRVQFKDGSLFEDFSGCYDLDIANASWSKPRENYNSYEANPKSARFGYCEEKRKWYLYEGEFENACDAEEVRIANSAKLYTFDIISSFEEPWYSSSGRPLELYFFDEEKSLNEEQCNSFLGDGICNNFFNDAEYDYDEGDCCAATCDETRCGIDTIRNVFKTSILSGNGYQNCRDEAMQPITIRLNDVYVPNGNGPTSSGFAAGPGVQDAQTREPLMILDCDGKNVLMVSINDKMMNKTETVKVADGANCIMMVTNTTIGNSAIWYANYTVFHGDENDIDNDPIVMIQGDSIKEEVSYFQRIPQCFFEKLKDHINLKTIYTGTDPPNQAVDWLIKDSEGFSSCERDEFLERYALATINFAAPIATGNSPDDGVLTQRSDQGLWITTGRHCVWRPVGCTGNIVTELTYDALGDVIVSGTIATEIGLLKNVSQISMSRNNHYGSIPSEIGQLKALNALHLNSNNLDDIIPTEVGVLTNLNQFDVSINLITGTIPSEIGYLTSLQIFIAYQNRLSGTIPSEFGQLTSLDGIAFDGNSMTGTIPSELGNLKEIYWVSFSYNAITGSIPSELGQTQLQAFIVDNNSLTGSVPSELLNVGQLDLFGNKLSNLIPIDENVICSFSEGQHYCNCGSHCLPNPDDPTVDKCACEGAEACCSSFLETNTECVLCEYGVENPDFFMAENRTSCEFFALDVSSRIKEFGTAEACDAIKEHGLGSGCVCNDSPPIFTKCVVCEFGVENPDFFLEIYGATCRQGEIDIFQDVEKYGLEANCRGAKTAYSEVGCKCNIDPPELDPSELTECIICESGLENPDFFVDEIKTCNDVSNYIRQNLTLYGKESQCIEGRVSMELAGCYCQENLGDAQDLGEYEECIICEFDLENPEFYIEDYQSTCADSTEYVRVNIEEYGTRSYCDVVRSEYIRLGCICNNDSKTENSIGV